MPRLSLGILLICPVLALAAAPQGYFGAQLGTDAERGGVFVVSVMPGSPAAKAGFEVDDLLVTVDTTAAQGSQELAQYLRERGAGTEVTVEFVRKRKTLRRTLTLGVNPWQDAERADQRAGLHAVRIDSDLAYRSGEGADVEKHRLDLYVPDSEHPAPLLLWIHGGGWSLGGRENEKALALRFAERGVAVAAMSYRLSPANWANPEYPSSGVTHPAHVNDVADAFAYLHTNAARLGLDASRLFVGGHSAGGHLAALMASDPSYLKARGLSLDVVAGALPIGGAYDIPDYHAALIRSDPELGKAHIEAVFGIRKDGWRHASPTEHLAASDVPMLVVVEDQAGFQRYARRLEDAAQRHGRSNITFLDAEGRTHGNVILLMSGRHEDEVRARMLEFMLAG